jgi:2-polyprenyl-3-methyl-5-hydroxy-6-metoxy-1,4-benzoquinol methylase
MSKDTFWNNVYKSKQIDAVSWYSDRLEISLKLINKYCPKKDQSIVDIGAGRSTLVDDLVSLNYSNLTLLDISDEAIKQTLIRLGKQGSAISVKIGDISTITTQENQFDLWHDRAVFHFLTEAKQRIKYKDNLKRSLKNNGIVVLATFGPNGPDKCSGLDTVKYSEQSLVDELGNDFQLLGSEISLHQTPFKTSQQFIYCWFRLKTK